MPSSLPDDTCGRWATSSVECGGKLCKEEEESEGLPKRNLPCFTKSKATDNNYIGSKPNGRTDLWWITRLNLLNALDTWPLNSIRILWAGKNIHHQYPGSWGEKQWSCGESSPPFSIRFMNLFVRLLPNSSTQQPRTLLYPQYLIRGTASLLCACMYLWIHMKLQGKI